MNAWHKTVVPALLAVVLASVAACGSAPDAKIQPAPATPDTTTTRTTSESTTSKYAEKRDPCSLLNASNKQQLGITGHERDDTGTGQGCIFHLSSWQGDEATIVGVTVKAGQPLDQLASRYGKTVDTTVGGEPAKRIRSATGGCIIAVASSPTSRVEISSYAGDQDAACQLSRKVAKVVQGNLAKGAS